MAVAKHRQLWIKATFAGVFKHAWMSSTSVDAAVKGFKEAGLFPLDEHIVTNAVKIDPRKTFAPADIPVEISEKATDAAEDMVLRMKLCCQTSQMKR